MSCRRPDSDFDETRSRHSFWAKTKFETPLSAIQAHRGGLRASKVANFDLQKNPFFGQIFFVSNRREMFDMSFSLVFSPEISSLSNF